MNDEEKLKKLQEKIEDKKKKTEEDKLKERLKELSEEKPKEIKETKKKKREILKWWSKNFNKTKLKKSNKIAVIYLRNNGNADLMELESKNGFFNIEGKPFHEDRDCIYTITKDRLPLAIVFEWDMLPIGTKKWDDQDMRDKFSQLETHVLKGIRHAELVKLGGGSGDEKKFTVKQAIIWGIAGIVAVAVLINYI